MNTTTRKQREILEREEKILEVARRMLLEQGYAGLSMDRLADAMEYSKGLVYSHFTSKEDLVVALAVQSLRQRVERFQRAAQFQGNAREKMLAIGTAEELFVRLHAHHFHSEQIIKMASLHERASSERMQELHKEEQCCFSVVTSIVAQAIENKELVLNKDQLPQELVLALWSLNYGCYTLLHIEREMLREHHIVSPFGIVRKNCEILLDGYKWHPLSTEWDYNATYKRILLEIFPEECLRAGLA